MQRKLAPEPNTIIVDESGTTVDMRSLETRAWYIAQSAARGLALEILTGMKVGRRGANPLTAAQHLGYEGRTKVGALRWLLEHFEIAESGTIAKALAK